MKFNPLTNAFETPIPPSVLTDEQVRELLRKNGKNHPATRKSEAELMEMDAKQAAEQSKKG